MDMAGAVAGRAGDTSGAWMHALARELWPFNRSITGAGLRQTLAVLQRELPSNLIGYADGTRDLISLAERIKVSALELLPMVERLLEEGVFEVEPQ